MAITIGTQAVVQVVDAGVVRGKRTAETFASFVSSCASSLAPALAPVG